MGNQCIREAPQHETDLSKKPVIVSFLMFFKEIVVNANEQPVTAQKGPYAVDLVEGDTYYWCSCGKSKNQPFCDGAHKGTTFEPLVYIHDKPDEKKHLCGCKHSKSKPFCDGTHNNEVDW